MKKLMFLSVFVCLIRLDYSVSLSKHMYTVPCVVNESVAHAEASVMLISSSLV